MTSVRAARRVGPDGQLTFDTVAEIIQRCTADCSGQPFVFLGGATVVFGIDGAVRFIVRKRLDNKRRAIEQQDYIANGGGERFWDDENGLRVPSSETFRLSCAYTTKTLNYKT